MIIQAISIKKTIGGNPLFEDLSCQIEAGEKNCLSRYQRNWQINLFTNLDRQRRCRQRCYQSQKGLKIGTVEQELTVSKQPSTTTCSILPLRYRTSNSK